MVMLDEMIDWPGSRDELRTLLPLLVQNCGCGCSFDDDNFVSASPTCTAVAVLRDRRFLSGLVFARSLAARLQAEERTTTSRGGSPTARS
jgi:hypothetical protein